MSPIEEQILRNQVVILNLLKFVAPKNREGNESLELGVRCLEETGYILQTEAQQGRTIHAYPA